MAVHVDEIMNHELFAVGPDERVAHVRRFFATLQIAAAPVVDLDQRPLGFVSLRDIADADDRLPVAEVMTSPADTIPRGSTIQSVAEMMARKNRHHLGVIDLDGRVVGYVGSLDVVRGLIGMPTPHPDTFPHYDPVSGVAWSNDFPLTTDELDRAPASPGLLRLIRQTAGARDRVVWSEEVEDVRGRLRLILEAPPAELATIAEAIETGAIRFRVALRSERAAAATDPRPNAHAYR